MDRSRQSWSCSWTRYTFMWMLLFDSRLQEEKTQRKRTKVKKKSYSLFPFLSLVLNIIKMKKKSNSTRLTQLAKKAGIGHNFLSCGGRLVSTQNSTTGQQNWPIQRERKRLCCRFLSFSSLSPFSYFTCYLTQPQQCVLLLLSLLSCLSLVFLVVMPRR